MSTNAEDRLKAALSARADLVTSDKLRPPVVPAPHPPRHLRLLHVALPLTAAAAVAAAIVTAVAVRPPVQNFVSPTSDRSGASPSATAGGEATRASRTPEESARPGAGGTAAPERRPERIGIDLPAYSAVSRGDRGTAVKVLQQILNDLHYQAGPADGYFGARTAEAVRRFSEQRALPADGEVFTEVHWAALLVTGDRPELRAGSSGDAVRRVQRALTALLGRTVTIDGYFGARTDSAIREFQQLKGLPVTGVVDAETWRRLAGGKAEPRPTDVPTPGETPSATTSPTPTETPGQLPTGRKLMR
jgi:peptidoglycan hydrolase-like protein with peptidoglycan-binding domain